MLGDKASLDQVDRIGPAFEKPKIIKDAKQKSIKIECRCKGKPEPKITWKKDKTEIKDKPNKYKISKTKGTDDTYVFILEILVSFSGLFWETNLAFCIFRVLHQRMVVSIKFWRKMMPVIRKH